MQIQEFRGDKLGIAVISSRGAKFLKRHMLIASFFTAHTIFAIFLGPLYALAPDETGYIYTFKNLYGFSPDPNPQFNSGWITAPKVFLWIVYLPAKIINILGVPDYLSIRILSILLATLSLMLLKNILGQVTINRGTSYKIIFIFFFVPSVFLWTSVGLREAFIIVEISAFLAGFNFLAQGRKNWAYVLLFLGSYGLISTKSYIWACLIVAVIISISISIFQGFERRKIVMLLVAGLFVPIAAFAGTTSVYALGFILHSDISASGQRSGDSISQIYVDTPGTGSSSGNGTGSSSGNGTGSSSSSSSGNGTGSSSKPTKELITFHGDYTLIALHTYLIDNPKSWFSKALAILHLDTKIQSIWDEKVKLGLVNKDKEVGTDTSSLNGHIIQPGSISNPISMIWPAFLFLCGPFPFIGDPGIAVGISALESPLWWAFYALIVFQFFRFRKVKFLRDPQILFTLIFLAGEIAFSALVEVNLGTSFRHRSILLVPLVFLYVRLAQRAKEQQNLGLGE